MAGEVPVGAGLAAGGQWDDRSALRDCWAGATVSADASGELTHPVATNRHITLEVVMDFTELKIAKGCGTFHVNQFRIHFSIPGLQGDPKQQLPALVGEFIKDFPRFFNGTQNGLTENKAVVSWSTKQFEHNKTLRFLLDFRSELLGINLPDVHSDWVQVLWQDPKKGFAAQTVKRNFAERADFLTSTLLPPLGVYRKVADQKGDIALLTATPTSPVDRNKPFAPEKPCLIQTAAIERYSALVPIDMGIILDDRAIVDRI
jgi:hypothetical protein